MSGAPPRSGLALALALAACAAEPAGPLDGVVVPEGVQAFALDGRRLRPPPLPAARRAELTLQLDAARADYAEDPGDADKLIWYGRRLAYLGLFREAVDLFSEGIDKHRYDPRLYRHRGHRLITLRQFAAAERDLTFAARLMEGRDDEIEPDGMPNAKGIPRSTLASNIFYHLGLARFLMGRFAEAAEAYEACLGFSHNPDQLCATTYWLSVTRRRLGEVAAARALLEPIAADMEILENHAYHRALLLMKGAATMTDGEWLAERERSGDPTMAYGIFNLRVQEGRLDAAASELDWLVENPSWPSFGVIAAEADRLDPARWRAAARDAPLQEAR